MEQKGQTGEIVMYQPDETIRLEVRMDHETVWLTQAQMVELFQTTKQNVSLHVGNVFREGELNKEGTVKEYLTVQTEGNRIDDEVYHIGASIKDLGKKWFAFTLMHDIKAAELIKKIRN